MRLTMDRLTHRRRGDPCGGATSRGHLVVYSTRILHSEGIRVRSLECSDCDYKPIWGNALDYTIRLDQ